MKSPEILRNKLCAQWFSADLREQRLLRDFNWPIHLVIGKPAPQILTNDPTKIQQHLLRWRKQKLGRVEWLSVKYKSATKAIDIPSSWLLASADEWVLACADVSIKAEFNLLSQIIKQIDPIFHQFIVRHRSLWSNKGNDQQETIVQCCRLAMTLKFGMANGLPLRALSIEGIDSKFLENQRGLITQLLNIRFSGALQVNDLEEFLGATHKGNHWLLIKPLSDGMLPFELLRLRSSELAEINLPANNLLIIENEQCHHLLPKLENTIAILGGGLDLSWMKNKAFKDKNIFYWGDLDTWGFKMLAIARHHQPKLKPILMDYTTYHQYMQFAVPEPINAGSECPKELTIKEAELYKKLLNSDNGRLEQERLPAKEIQLQLLNDII